MKRIKARPDIWYIKTKALQALKPDAFSQDDQGKRDKSK